VAVQAFSVGQLQMQLKTPSVPNPELARYAASLVFLETNFSADQTMQKTVRDKLKVAQAQSEHFGASNAGKRNGLIGYCFE
jgi:high frequency lysogenization protein